MQSPPNSSDLAGSVRRIAFAVGDTTGHVMLPLATAEAYGRVASNLDVLFLAAPGGPAAEIVPAAGYRLAMVPASQLMRVGLGGKAVALARLVPGIVRARAHLQAHGSRLVIGSGGYASGCVLLAARTLRLQTAIIEPNAVPGLANALLERVVGRAYVTFDEAAARTPREARVVTGTPIRPVIVEQLRSVQRKAPRDRPLHVFVTGGSRGERFFGERVPPLLAAMKRMGLALEVRHHVGTLALDPVVRAYEVAGMPAMVTPFVRDMADTYAWADLAIARAGATTLAELALAGLPSLLVPLSDAAADHQAANASAYASTGGAVWMREADWNQEDLARQLATILLNPEEWERMAGAARRASTPEAAENIARDCERVMRGRW